MAFQPPLDNATDSTVSTPLPSDAEMAHVVELANDNFCQVSMMGIDENSVLSLSAATMSVDLGLNSHYTDDEFSGQLPYIPPVSYSIDAEDHAGQAAGKHHFPLGYDVDLGAIAGAGGKDVIGLYCKLDYQNQVSDGVGQGADASASVDGGDVVEPGCEEQVSDGVGLSADAGGDDVIKRYCEKGVSGRVEKQVGQHEGDFGPVFRTLCRLNAEQKAGEHACYNGPPR